MAGRADTADLDDSRLLERFVTHRDGGAFETLLRRHGPMVHGVCRRVLYDPQDTEDAFQATFLVLIRKAHSLSRRELLAQWLYGVAYRTALKAKVNRAQRVKHQRPMTEATAPDANADPLWRDLRSVLDEEVNRLPEKYRLPVVLCYLEGKTFAEAAQRLGWREGTVSGRLFRAREMLRRRLTRRGVSLSAGILSAILSEQASSAVPAGLTTATLKAATIVLTSEPRVAGAVSASVLTLVEGVLRTMFMTKLKIAAVLLILGLVGAGTGLATYHRFPSDQPGSAVAVPGQPIPEEVQPPVSESLPVALLSDEKVDALLAASTANDKLKPLLKERYQAASVEMESRYKDFVAGRGTLDILFGSSRRLLEAERELSDRKADQIAALERRWKILRAVEQLNQARFNAGRIPIHDLAVSRFHRLDAEIMLERAKAAEKGPRL
jgi:RNA polymerase sigma factor (sigma-70 family)